MSNVAQNSNARPLETPEPPASDPNLEAALAPVDVQQRGGGAATVLETAADDLLLLISTMEHDPNGGPNGTVIRQLLEIWEVLDVVQKALHGSAVRKAAV